MIPGIFAGGAGASGGGGPATDPHWMNVASLLHFNGTDGSSTFTDQKGLTWAPSGNVQIDTAQSQFGGASGLFDGSGDYIACSDHAALALGSSDFTIEFWIRTTQTTTYAALLSKPWGTGGWGLFLNGGSSGPMEIWCADYSGSAPLLTASGTGYRDGNWHHVAWVRSGSNFALYIDGTPVATTTSGFAFQSASGSLAVGDDLIFGSRSYSGHMDELRITIGVARYTSSFTPPGAQFPDS